MTLWIFINFVTSLYFIYKIFAVYLLLFIPMLVGVIFGISYGSSCGNKALVTTSVLLLVFFSIGTVIFCGYASFEAIRASDVKFCGITLWVVPCCWPCLLVNCIGWCCHECFKEAEQPTEEYRPSGAPAAQRGNAVPPQTVVNQDTTRVEIHSDSPYASMEKRPILYSDVRPLNTVPVVPSPYYNNNNNVNSYNSGNTNVMAPSAPPMVSQSPGTGLAQPGVFVPLNKNYVYSPNVVTPSQPILSANNVEPTYGSNQTTNVHNADRDMDEQEKQLLKASIQRSLEDLQQSQRDKLNSGNANKANTQEEKTVNEPGVPEIQIEGGKEEEEKKNNATEIAKNAGKTAAKWGSSAGKAVMGWTSKKVQELNAKYNEDEQPQDAVEGNNEGKDSEKYP